MENVLRSTEVKGVNPVTLAVLQRIIDTRLSIQFKEDRIVCRNRVFSDTTGMATVNEIADALEKGKVVVLDTSKIGDDGELLIGSMIASEIFSKYQNYKAEGLLTDKLPVSVVIEEAPRVLGADTLQLGDNIYSRIAREGRKFKVGLVAITQLTSVIPRDILTNMNTKIILGTEMANERMALISSAAQDLSDDDRTIASLDKGEAIVSSIFTKFAVPIQIPLFDELVEERNPSNEKIEYSG